MKNVTQEFILVARMPFKAARSLVEATIIKNEYKVFNVNAIVDF